MISHIKIIGISLLLFFSACKQDTKNEFVVDGTIKNVTSHVIFLEEVSLTNTQPVIVDSALIKKDGSFQLNTIANEENLYVLRLTQELNPVATLINDSKHITVEADLKNEEQPYTVKGSIASGALVDYLINSNKKLATIYNMSVQLDSLNQTPENDSAVNVVNRNRKEMTDDYTNYVNQLIKNSQSPSLTIFTLGSYQSYATNPAFGLQAFSQQNMLDIISQTASKFPAHKGLASLQNSLQKQSSLQNSSVAGLLNKQAPDFTLPDTKGNPVSLSSFKGKYVLIDFWASWCKPCRIENPNLVRAYQQFRAKNFTILGVSLDKQKDDWVKAIDEDKLVWTHASDLKFWDSMVVPMYGIESIPHNVLMDPNGVVIAEKLTGEGLIQKLSEVLK
jgi:peroxiredoxin